MHDSDLPSTSPDTIVAVLTWVMQSARHATVKTKAFQMWSCQLLAPCSVAVNERDDEVKTRSNWVRRETEWQTRMWGSEDVEGERALT